MFFIGLPVSFHYGLGVYIFIIHFSKLSLTTEKIKAPNLLENIDTKYLYHHLLNYFLLLLLSKSIMNFANMYLFLT